jgi:hypothetical protein
MIGEPPLWRQSHVDGLEIPLRAGSVVRSPRAVPVSAQKAAPVVHAEMYGAGLIGGNADQVLK